ncbi:glycosyltransferase family 4 protein [Microbacterium sp. SD291]|uniref:glycosyltransferase family 4 protein n=1 Tax=Microbacterium sp. SD291 TaxID=2782007 RepID=UPI001A9761FC|nr:glycosyltransferase family 4 protein [Microbacterium sp. SD291]MBO0980982.1 glycosyltransferase family 4 protein [Microbacterium sp. SD291]
MCSDRFAGVERFVLRLAIAQADAGHDVRVAGGDPALMAPALEAAGVPFTRGTGVGQLVRALRSVEVDVANTHMTAADGAAAIAFGIPGRHPRPAVVSTRHFASARGGVGPLRWDRVLAGRIDAEIAISRAVAASTGVPSTIVHTGVPNVTSDRVRHSRTILMAQRLQPEKQTALGVRAFAASGLADSGWRLLIAGDGPDGPLLDRLARDLGVADAVTLLGFREDVPALLDEAGMLLATCPKEGLGISVLEAMSHGVPVIAAGAAGHLDLLEDLDPRALFPPENASAAASALRSLAADADGRSELGTAVRLRQRQRFSLPEQVAGTDAVYRAALGRRVR